MTSAVLAFPPIGSIPIPDNFKYKDVLQRGRPAHEQWDSFRLKHPPMTAARWAKIFSPFDALTGFDERIAEQEIRYEAQKELCEEEVAELDRRLNILHNLTRNHRMAKANHVRVSVDYFIPCAEENRFASRTDFGKYETVIGTVLRLEMKSLLLRTGNGAARIPFCDIREIRAESGIFETKWETDIP